MRIRAGYELVYECPQPTPMVLALSIHPSRCDDLLTDQVLQFSPDIQARDYIDGFGNICTRILAPAGATRISTLFEIEDSGRSDEVAPHARQHAIDDLPSDVLVYLLGSRYCDTDRLSDFAWAQFGNPVPGWGRVQSIVDFVHNHIIFNYRTPTPAAPPLPAASSTAPGVCNFAHLRHRPLPLHEYPCALLHRLSRRHRRGARARPDGLQHAWFQVWLGGRWYTFDARHNRPRIGRILMATGRDATDVAIPTSYGPSRLAVFKVVTEELPADALPMQQQTAA